MKSINDGINASIIGQKCIIRTYSAGVWFGEISQKEGQEVIVKNSRRLWHWVTNKSISLSAVALWGIKHKGSSIAPTVDTVWLEAIEIIPCTSESIASIEGAPDA